MDFLIKIKSETKLENMVKDIEIVHAKGTPKNFEIL